MGLKKFNNIVNVFLFSLFFSSVCHSDDPPIIASYFGIWTETAHEVPQTWEQKFRADTPFDKINRLYVSFANVVKKADGHHYLEWDGDADNARALVDAMKSAHTEEVDIFVSIGGDNYDEAVNDPEFANNIKQFLVDYDLNGVDIDWEYNLNKNRLNKLVTLLYSSLHQDGYKLTLDVWPFVHPAYDMAVLRDNLDQINIMSYGVNRYLSSEANAYAAAGFPKSKMIGGIETEADYREAGGVDTLGPQGSIARKANYVLDNGLAGIMSWRMGNDYATDPERNVPTYVGAVQLWENMMGNENE